MQGRQNKQNRPYKPYIHRGRVEVTEITPVIIVAEEITDIGLMMEYKRILFFNSQVQRL